MNYLILTIDYEIFGNGTGDVYQHIIKPAAHLASLGKSHGVPLTYFIEVEEYIKHLEYRDVLKRNLGYDPASMMEEQIRSFIKDGHDVQLHLHPQWLEARYENRRWYLRNEQTIIDNIFKGQEEVTHYITDRKARIEKVLHQVQPERTIKAFRAGGFCAQPAKKLLSALEDNQILIESSVVKGLYESHGTVQIDYRRVSFSKRMWKVKNDVCKEDFSGKVYEVPIHSVMRRRFCQLGLRRLKAKFSQNVPKERQKEMIHKLGIRWNPIQMARFLWQTVPVKLDFHNLSSGTLIRWVQSAMNEDVTGLQNVLVLIGHTKEHIDALSLNRFLEAISAEPNIKVVTFDCLAKLLEHNTYGN